MDNNRSPLTQHLSIGVLSALVASVAAGLTIWAMIPSHAEIDALKRRVEELERFAAIGGRYTDGQAKSDLALIRAYIDLEIRTLRGDISTRMNALPLPEVTQRLTRNEREIEKLADQTYEKRIEKLEQYLLRRQE